MFAILVSIIAIMTFGCASTSPWKTLLIPNADELYDLVKLSYMPDDPFKGMEIECIRYGKTQSIYLNVHHHHVPLHAQDGQSTDVYLSSDRGKWHFLAHRLKGGQRVKLPEKASSVIIQELRAGCPLTIRCGHFKQTLSPQDFKRNYRLLTQSSPSFLSRERLNIEL